MKNIHISSIGLLFILALAMISFGTAAWAAPSTTVAPDGVVVKKNADGSLEVYDAPEAAPTQLKAQTPKADRVVVKKNADGSMEVYDDASAQADAANAPRPVFEVAPVVATRKPLPSKKPSTKVQPRTWTSGISAL